MNEMDEKKTFKQFLQAQCPREKEISLGEEIKW
jgi:hypothetical protein